MVASTNSLGFAFPADVLFNSPETTVCPKCFGLGKLRLMRRGAIVGAVEICPTCEGRGIVARKNGAADLAPASIGHRH
jgi:hypothetical protein